MSNRYRWLAGGLAALAASLAVTSTAAADTSTPNPFGCRASLWRVGALPSPVIEPTVANRVGTPCMTDADGVNSTAASSPSTPVAFGGPAGVFTYSSTSEPTTTGPVAPGAAALASVDGVTIPTGTGSVTIVGPAQALVQYRCVNGSLESLASSTLDAVYVNGSQQALPAPGAPETIPLGGGSYVSVNEQINTGTSLTERVLDIHLAGLPEIVVGEASVSQTASDPCAAGGTSPQTNPCPAGSTYDPVDQVCVIVLPGTTIVIGPPFQGPYGGTVVPLGVARKRYHSRCLYGPGPNYAIVGTNHRDDIIGTHRSERILGLAGNDRIAGQGGSDCIDGGAGKDHIWAGGGHMIRVYGGSGSDRVSVQNGNARVWGGSGNDRIFLGDGRDKVWGGSGNDRISVGRGDDYLSGGSGNDTISAGDGNDRILGGAGNDWIYAGNGRDHIEGGAGNDRIYSNAQTDYVECGAGRDLVYVNPLAKSWAAAHGCETVRGIRPTKP